MLLGETLLRREGAELYQQVEDVRACARRARLGEDGAATAFGDLGGQLAALPVEAATCIARAFSHFLHLANVAEEHHRIRARRHRQRDAGAGPQRGSLEEALPRLARIAPPDRVYDAVLAMRVELVMTAHPTEMVRRTLQRKYAAIAEALGALEYADAPRDRQRVVETLQREIAAAWETGDVRHERPSPTDEVRAGFAVFERSIWNAVPEYLRSLDRVLAETTGRRLPLEAAPIRFGSWIGGDRDGNPSITPEVTRRACLHSRWLALTLYARDVAALGEDLSMTRASEALRACVPGAAEPYRALLRKVHRDLEATRRAIEDQLSTRPGGRGNGPRAGEIYRTAGDLERPLRLCYDSLHETGNAVIADGPLADVLRRLACFGLTLARLDVRQDAARHTDAMDLIARQCGRAGYAQWTEEERIAFLVEALTGGIEAVGSLPNNPRVADVLQTFDMLATIPAEALGAYVITMAARPSDVMAVEYLQRRGGIAVPLRVVPLFETERDLRAAPAVLDRLLSIPWYRARIAAAGDRQEVMIGYSDPAKEIGRLATAWELYRAQEAIAAACGRHGVDVTFFHGRGGSIGRGGGPTHLALQSQPAGTTDGTLRVTEQGEMIQAKFGLPGTALRTLEVYTAATLDAMLAPPATMPAEWRATMDRLAAGARRAFRGVVYEDARFPGYFRAVTPQAELDSLHIGSRPARRAGDGLAGLRAIPWHFAWMQTRLLLASWLGAEALGAAPEDDRRRFREMYRDWPFFRSLVDLLEIALGKADEGIAAQYDERLAPSELRDFGAGLRERLREATAAVLAITGRRELLAANQALRRSIDVRNPYVDPINLCQIELLRRLAAIRGDEAQAPAAAALREALRITIGGVAAGMRNTG
jgi:phosphoenolpyruvate carboxylase